jgi:hypothetical protein
MHVGAKKLLRLFLFLLHLRGLHGEFNVCDKNRGIHWIHNTAVLYVLLTVTV